MPKETPKSKLAPHDVGLITTEHKTRYADVANLLAHHNQLAATYVAIDDTFDALLPSLNPELAHAIRQEMSDIGETLKQLQTISSPRSSAEEQAMRDLNTLAVLQQDQNNPFAERCIAQGEEDALFFSEKDREAARAARADTATSHWLPKRVGLKTDVRELVGRAGPHAAFKAKVEEQKQLAASHEKREAARMKFAEYLKQTINVAELSRLEAHLGELAAALQLMESGGSVVQDAHATALQKIRARRAVEVATTFLLSPKEERARDALTTAEADLRRALDLPRLATQARLRIERMVIDVLEQMATARVEVKGLQNLFDTLPLAQRPDAEALHAAQNKLRDAGDLVEARFCEARATTDHVLRALEQGREEPETVEGLVSTIQNGNLRELYLASFDEAMTGLRQAILEFSRLLKLAPSKELQARPDVRALRSAPRRAESALERAESDPKLEAVREAERKRLKKFFGKNIEVPELPRGMTPEKIETWERKGFKLEYWPREDMQENKNFPGWQHKPGKRHTPNQNFGIEFYDELQKIQTLPENAQNPHLQGLSPTELPGAWVLEDARKKPDYRNGDQTYENDQIIQGVLQELTKQKVLNAEASQGLRNRVHPDLFQKPELWKAFKAALDLDDIPGATVRLPRLIEANVMGQGPDFHDTSTSEWCEEYCQSGGRLISGGSDYGGASVVGWRVGPYDDVGFRPLVVFSSELGSLDSRALELWEQKVEKLRNEESAKLSAFFEKRINVPPLPIEITPERLAHWEQLGLKLHYLPAENMTKDRQLKAWKKKPEDWFYEQIAAGKLPADATQLPEGWFVIDGRQKPAYQNGDQMYAHDPLASALADLNRRGIISQTNYDKTKQLDPNSRFGLSPADFDKPEVIATLAKALDLDPSQFSLTETMVWNVLANIHHPEWGTTNTSEWQKETFGSGWRLISGHSDLGGASYVNWRGRPYDNVGFRPLGRFS